MGNWSNEENWATRERLRIVERALWWRGWVGRRDLTELFGISAAQASGDLQRYLELNPGALTYHTSRKRYESVPGSAWVMAEPNLEEGIAIFLGGGERVFPGSVGDGDRVAGLGLPVRRGSPEVERAVVMATATNRVVRARYWSVHSQTADWRDLRPHAFAHDGYRWHFRAWCPKNEAYRDFVLSRIEAAEWPRDPESGADGPDLPRDADWETWETISVRANRRLSAPQQRAIELDYGIAKPGGTLELPVRRAMREYLLAHLRVPGQDLPKHLEVAI